MMKYVEYIKNNNLGIIYTDKTFKQLTTLKIGGKIKLLYYPNSIENFITFYIYYVKNNCNKNLVIIGNGSNILANSKDYDGIVICFKKIKYKFCLFQNILTVSSGVMIMDVINYCKRKNLGGLEKLALIPGTIGGMIKMNASAYNVNISDNILWVKVIDERGNINLLYKNDIDFSYRKSNIDGIIVEACFKMNNINETEIDKVIAFVKDNRRSKQPIECYNAGSTFKNIGDICVWKLIDELGLRGFCINDAEVSKKHCNFLINKNSCNSDDMCELVKMIKDKIYNKYLLHVQCEWIFINF